MMFYFNQGIEALFDWFFLPFEAMNPWATLVATSLLATILMLLAYRFASNQQGIRQAKDRIQGHLLEVRLYRDEPRTVLRAQVRILHDCLRYFGYAVVPLLILTVPLLLILVQLDLRLGRRALFPSETAVVKVFLKSGHQPTAIPVVLESAPGIAVETPPLRIDEGAEIDWRIKAVYRGSHWLRVILNQEAQEIHVEVETSGLSLLPRSRVGIGTIHHLFHPRELPLPANSAISSIEVSYPTRTMRAFGVILHWMIWFFLLTLVLGLILKGFFHLEM